MCKVLKAALAYFRIFLDHLIDLAFSLVWNCQKKTIPDVDKKYAFLKESTVVLAEKIRNKELKSEDLVRAVVERIKLVNPIINAIVEERFEDALAEAREIDKRIANGIPEDEFKNKPFLGKVSMWFYFFLNEF